MGVICPRGVMTYQANTALLKLRKKEQTESQRIFRPYRRFSVFSPVKYESRLGDGHETVTNLLRFR